MFITNFTVSGGDANDFSSVNCPFSIFSKASRAASSTGSALALHSIDVNTAITFDSHLQLDRTGCLHFLHGRLLQFDLATFIISERLNSCSRSTRWQCIPDLFLRHFVRFGSDYLQGHFSSFRFGVHLVRGDDQILLQDGRLRRDRVELLQAG